MMFWIFSNAFFFYVILVILFWLLIFVFYYECFFRRRDPRGEMSELARAAAFATEKDRLRDDLENKMKIRRLPVLDKDGNVIPPPTNVNPLEPLYNLGLARNETNVQLESKQEHSGDHWLSADRWLWFAFFQLIAGSVLMLIISWVVSYWRSDRQSALVLAISTFIAIVFALGYPGYRAVASLNRLEVRRFGRHLQFLQSGPNFLLPFIESYDVVNLRRVVWSPNTGNSDPDHYLPGYLGADANNPSPGKFAIDFLGKWPFTIIVSVTLGTRRDSPSAWYDSIYEFSSPEEIGEQLAQIILPVLSTKTRELQGKTTTAKSTQSQLQILLEFLNQVPEICGMILVTLQESSQQELAGMIIESVALTSIIPDPGFRKVVQEIDTQRIHGEGDVARWEQQSEFWRNIPEEQRELFQYMQMLLTQQAFANQSSDALENLAKGLGLLVTRAATTNKPGGPI